MKTGRKNLSPKLLKSKNISGRLTESDFKKIENRRGKMKPLAWLIETALRKPPRIIPPINQKAWADLGKSLGNLNQIAKHFNQGAGDLDAARAQVAELRKKLIGVLDDESQNNTRK